MKLSKKNKTLLFTFFAGFLNIKLFFLVSSYSQVLQIFKYSSGFFDFYQQAFSYYWNFLFTIEWFTLLMYIFFSVVVFYFWYTYFRVYFNRLPETKIHGGAKYKVLANFFTLIGFGCVACGQTLIYSLLLLLGSQSLLFLGNYIGNLVMFIGIILLLFGIRENQRLYRDRNICRL